MSVDLGGPADISGYRILRRLGSGGMGQVYLVAHPRLPREDALKLLDTAVSRDPQFRTRFQHEADLLAGLRHPNIITIYDRGEYEGRLWLTMEYIPGQDAADLLNAHGPMPLDLALQIIGRAGAALDYAYTTGRITHRDLKPERRTIPNSEHIPIQLHRNRRHHQRTGQVLSAPQTISDGSPLKQPLN